MPERHCYLWALIWRSTADFIYSQYAMESGSTFQPMVWQIAEDLSRADVLLRLPGHSPMPAFRAVQDIPLIARLPRRSRAEVAHCRFVMDAVCRLFAHQYVAQHQGSNAAAKSCALLYCAQVRKELGIGQDERVVLLMYGGQPAGAWHLRAQVHMHMTVSTACLSQAGKADGLSYAKCQHVSLLSRCRRVGGVLRVAAASRWGLGRSLPTSCWQMQTRTHQIWCVACHHKSAGSIGFMTAPVC